MKKVKKYVVISEKNDFIYYKGSYYGQCRENCEKFSYDTSLSAEASLLHLNKKKELGLGRLYYDEWGMDQTYRVEEIEVVKEYFTKK